MSTDIKLNKHQTSKMIQSGGSFGSWFGNLGKEISEKGAFFIKNELCLF